MKIKVKKVYERVSGLRHISVSCWRPSSGKKRKMRIAQNVDSVELLLLSEENVPGIHKQFVRFRRQEFPKLSA